MPLTLQPPTHQKAVFARGLPPGRIASPLPQASVEFQCVAVANLGVNLRQSFSLALWNIGQKTAQIPACGLTLAASPDRPLPRSLGVVPHPSQRSLPSCIQFSEFILKARQFVNQ